MRLVVLLLTCLVLTAQAGPLTVHLDWEYHELPARMQVYDLAPTARLTLWQTGEVADISQLPLGSEWRNSETIMAKGATRRFVLVLRNDTAGTLHFFATPHHVDPAENALGFKFKCLCIDHAFSVPAGHVWYRVVELRTKPQMQGERLQLTHQLVGVDATRAKAFALPAAGGATAEP